MSILDKIKSVFRRAEDVADGGIPVATVPGDADREGSTNAQVEGAVGEPYPEEEED